MSGWPQPKSHKKLWNVEKIFFCCRTIGKLAGSCKKSENEKEEPTGNFWFSNIFVQAVNSVGKYENDEITIDDDLHEKFSHVDEKKTGLHYMESTIRK